MSTQSDPRRQFSEQIDRLQKRHLELVSQATAELETLKQQVETSTSFEDRIQQEKQPLLQEIAELRGAIAQLEKERNEQADALSSLEQQFNSYNTQLQGVLDTVKNSIRGSMRGLDQQIRSFSSDATHNLDSVLTSLESAALPSLQTSLKKKGSVKQPAPLPAVYHEAPLPSTRPSVAPLPAEKPKAERNLPKVRLLPSKKMLIRFASLALLATAGYGGWQHMTKSPVETGKVAGVSTDKTVTQTASAQPESDYKESFADLPFDQTKWDTTVDPDFGITMEYPSNTSNRIHTVGGSNLWFLRQGGYLMKITKLDYDGTAEAWLEEHKEELSEYSLSKSTFKGVQGWKATADYRASNSGYQYIIKKGVSIYQFWIKDELPTSDDGQRIARMVASIQITNK